MKTVLLVGNGINRLNGNGVSWDQVLFNITEQINADELLKDKDEKPYTLI